MNEPDDAKVSNSGTGKGGRGRKRGRPPSRAITGDQRSSKRTPKWVNKFKVEERWTMTDKYRLLEGLRRYHPHNVGNITKLVGTKTEAEVEEKIEALRGRDSLKGQADRVEGSDQEYAPIETWIDLVQEMISREPTDYSYCISKVLGLITRNEKFEDSGHAKLRWRNIYQFLADLAEDKVELQQLSDLESLVVLDLMHSLGETLYSSDTSEQRRILDFKYNLLKFRMDNPSRQEREMIRQRIAQALSNDFWDLDEPGTSSTRAATASTYTCTASTSTAAQHQEEATSSTRATSSGTVHSMEINSASAANQRIPNMSDPAYDEINPGTSEMTYYTNRDQSEMTNQAPAVGSASPQTSLMPDEAGPLPSPTHGVTEDRNPETSEVRKTSADRSTDQTWPPARTMSGKNFDHPPPFFTLNPLCVPTKLLAFQPKAGSSGM